MRIGINALFWIPGRTGGSETYLLSLLDRWHQTLNDEVTLFAGVSAAEKLSRFDRWRVVELPFNEDGAIERLRAEQMRLPGVVAEHKLDVLFSPGNVLPTRVKIPQVLTIHDLQHRHFPQYFDWKRRAARRVLFARSAKKARRIVAISEATRHDLISLMKVPAKKIRVVYEGVDQQLAEVPADKLTAVQEKYQLPERFIYLPGKTFPHKNHLTLLDAIELLNDRKQKIPLVLTGGADVAHEQVLARIQRNGLAGQVRHLGFIDFDEIGAMYHLAEMLVFPSSFEGFGLPVVEAMVCGCPVVTSDKMSLAELVGDAAMTVEPTDASALAEAIAKVWHDDDLRADMTVRGRRRAAAFSWDDCADKTYRVLVETVS